MPAPKTNAPNITSRILISFILLIGFIFGAYVVHLQLSQRHSYNYEITASQQGNHVYQNSNTGLTASFLDSTDPHFLYQLRDDKIDSSLTFFLDPQQYPGVQNTRQKSQLSENKLIIKDVAPETDLIYQITENGVKEDIRLNTPEATASAGFYSFIVKASNLRPAQSPDGKLLPTFINQSGQPTDFQLIPPFMVDASGNRSDNVYLTIFRLPEQSEGSPTGTDSLDQGTTDSNSNTYRIIITPDPQWLNSPDRQFPISVDPTVVRGNGPVGEWSFDEGYDTNTYDKSTNANTGSITGALWEPESECVKGKCLDFDGSNDLVSMGDQAELELTTFTISAWVNKSGTCGAFSECNIVSKGQNSSTGFSLRLKDYSGSFKPSLSIKDSTQDVQGNTVIIDNRWYHLAASINGTTVKIYVNGILDTSTSQTPTPNFSTEAFKIGNANTGNDLPFNGKIDEVKIYDYVRTDLQIKNDYIIGAGSYGTAASFGNHNSGKILSDALVGYWKLDESAADTCTGGSNDSCDSSGNGTDGAWTGNAVNAGGKFGNGVTMDGTGDYIQMSSSSDEEFDYDANESFTISLWAKLTDDNSIDSLINKTNGSLGSTGNTGFDLLYRGDTTNVTQCRINDGSGSSIVSASTNSNIGDSSWHHVLCVVDKSSGIMTLYLDGVIGDEDSISSETGSMAVSQPLRIGTHHNASDWYATGSIDDVRIYNRALSQSEVRALYNWAPGPVAYYDLNENTGTSTVYDKSSSGYSASMNGTMTAADWVPGKYGSALDFDGSDDYVEMTTSPVTDYPFTQCAWFKLDALNQVPLVTMIQNGADHYAFLNAWDDGLVYASVDAGSFAEAVSTNSYTANTWNHACAVYTSGSSRQVYLNGIPGTIETTNVGTPSTLNRLSIGRRSSASPFYGEGIIDEVKVYNYALTSSQVIQDMNGGHPIGGSPVGSQFAYYKFNEGSGSVAYDSGPNGFNLSEQNFYTDWTLSGKFDKAWEGDGGHWWRFPSATAEHSLTASGGSFSISTWVKSDSASNPASNEFIIGNWANGFGSSGFALYFNTNGEIVFGIDDDATSFPEDDAGDTASNTDYYDAQWHHVVAIKNASSSMSLYVDGKLVETDSSISATGTINGDWIRVGADDGSDDGDELNGDLDELKIYATALTTDQIYTEYLGGVSTKLGSLGTTSAGVADDSAARAYCVPGDSSTCNPPTLHWNLDEKTGSTAYDISGNGYDGFIDNGPVWISGRKGSAIKMHSSNNYESVSISDPGSGDLDFGSSDDFTISTWIKTTSFAEGPIILRKVANLSESVPGYVIYTAEAGGSNTIVCDIYDNNGGTATDRADYNTDDTVVDGQWHHIACILDRDGSQFGLAGLHLFIDGYWADSDTTINTTGSLANAETFYAGEGSTDDLPEGGIDDVRVYRYARSVSQINWEYNRGAPVAWYKMDECTGTTIYNWAPNAAGDFISGINATLTVGATGSNTATGTCSSGTSTHAWNNGTAGKYGASIDLDATDDRIVVSTPVSNYTDTMAISGWYNWDGSTGDDQYLWYNGNAGSNGWGVFLESSDSNQIALLCENSGTVTSDTGLVSDAWTHVLASNGVDGWKIYINGTQITIGGDTSCGVSSITTRSVIGDYDGSGGSGFNGKVDDVRFFNYVPNATQIKEIMNSGSVNFQ